MKVRFAPSPTGYLHIGGARTGLFNWLHARRHGGKFLLRIEDTDRQRSKKEYLEEILDSMKWLGLDWDELVYQSARFDVYRARAQKLLEEGKAYPAEDGSGAVFLKMPHKKVVIEDMIHGSVVFDTALLKDQVLIKSDGSPTYNFACVVDDAEMEVTHIIRGDDHISNTPKQIVFYEALGYPLPRFAHIPMILGAEGGRMSKRAGATAISEYRAMGFLPGALANYLMFLGWSPGDEREILTLEEAVPLFTIEDAGKTAAAFNMDKLLWLNAQYIKTASPVRLAELLGPFLRERYPATADNFNGNNPATILKLYLERARTLAELADNLSPFFVDEVVIDEALREKYFSGDLAGVFARLAQRFEALADFRAAAVEEAFRSSVAEMGLAVKAVIHPLRVALSGKTGGPGMFELIEALGKETTLRRMERVGQLFKKEA
ncbi:MAG: glutamate--tRNA ligase [Deltaproteobacteria bacterium]